MKKRSLLFTILCGMLSFSACAALTSCAGKETSEEPLLTVEHKEEEEKSRNLNLRDLTTLDVITDNTQFTPVALDQSYNPETDMNPNIKKTTGRTNITDAGDTVYMSYSDSALFAFHKDTQSADIACTKPDCAHDAKTVGGDCQANLRVLDASIGELQYYNGELYYTLGSGGASILYKISPDRETKQQYISLVGEKGYGNGTSLIHRGYIYFSSDNDGIYRMPVDNPLLLERIIDITGGETVSYLQAYGSYVYFIIRGDKTFAMARYNIESNQIEQFMGIEEFFGNYEIYNEKIYYSGYIEGRDGEVIYQYDIATGENEVFMQGEDKKGWTTSLRLIHVDLDYFYIRKNEYKNMEFISEDEYMNNITYEVYIWDKTFAGEIFNLETYDYSDSNELEPFKIIPYTETEMVGSDSDRIYYMSREYDTQVQENGVIKDIVEGTEKTVIYYIDKSEISTEGPAQVYTAGEIYD